MFDKAFEVVDQIDVNSYSVLRVLYLSGNGKIKKL